ncbi:PIN domain-containing protein [Compostibacter hankyongensis]|uniref:PIN domain-containing protein n=1 Tax=Compostibacter hankyongensis TaxID=1007089 RepID=UPI0031E83E57
MDKAPETVCSVRIIVDTNIVFSAILNTTGRIGKVLIGSGTHFQFYTCDFLRIELQKHRGKLLKITKLTEGKLHELELLITSNIKFINESLIAEKQWLSANILLKDIDPNDTPFVALAKELDAKLWTGDMQLYHGLKEKRFKAVITTAELSFILDELERK